MAVVSIPPSPPATCRCRAATSAAQKLPDNWEELVNLMVKRVALMVQREGIPKELIYNLDQTGCYYL